MFKVSVLDIEKTETLFTQFASCVILPSVEGELTILDFHQPIISCLKQGHIKIDQNKPIAIKRGLAKLDGGKLVVMVER